MTKISLRKKVVSLRKKGKTYSEIQNLLENKISKSTLSLWCRDIVMPIKYVNSIEVLKSDNLSKARIKSRAASKQRQIDRFKNIIKNNQHLSNLKYNKDAAKVMLAIIYLCEGTKQNQSNASITLGNSDPLIIKLFLQLLRFCYTIDEDKFRCTVQCRHDQNIKSLELFWSGITKISRKQFYGARIDPRSIGKKSLKPQYKGVCRINYFSSDVFWDLTKIGEIICSD